MKPRLPIFCALVLVVAACKAKDAGESAVVVDSTATVAAATSLPGGSLPAGWDTLNSEEFRNSVASITWEGGDTAARECEHVSKCGPSGETKAGIIANHDALEITAANGGVLGAVIAKMYLVGNNGQDTKHYKLKPNSTNFVVVKADATGGGMHYFVMRVANQGNAKIDTAATGVFQLCDSTAKPDSARATWWGCKSHLLHAAKTKADSLKIRGKEYPDQDGWVSCASGCCVLLT